MRLFAWILPAVCEGCGRQLARGERGVCAACLGDLSWHIIDGDSLRERLPRSLPIGQCLSWTAYRREATAARLIKRGKYSGRPDIIEELADIYARRLVADGALAGVDALQAVPMHWWKRIRRGYNQADLIARQISRASGIPVIKALKAVRGHSSQTRRTAAGRAKNVEGMFAVARPESVARLHIALVDDVITTGSTLSEAAHALVDAGAARISIVTLAAAAQ